MEDNVNFMDFQSKYFHTGVNIHEKFYKACVDLYISIKSKKDEEITDEELSFIFYFVQTPEVQRRLNIGRNKEDDEC